ncbi:P-loop NTPase fold protein, partial [Enterococcus entomosocium]
MKHDVTDQTRKRMSHENFKFWEKNKNSIEESVELPWIDTSQEAEYFSDLLKVNRIIFLNGEWGSGKTEFLKKIRDTSDKNFIDINLWNKK